MHQAQGFDYPFPLELDDPGTAGIDDPIFLSKLVLETDGAPTGRGGADLVGPRPRAVMASLLRLTAEVYLLHDPRAGTPRQRWQWLLALHRAAEQDAYDRGLADVHCWLPPQVQRPFGRRLLRLGWEKQLWPSFSRKLPPSR